MQFPTEVTAKGDIMSLLNRDFTAQLPAKELVSDCYEDMFNGCSKLQYVKALFTTEPSEDTTGDWLSGVAASGTFVKSKDATWNVTGAHGIPEGWKVETE